MTPPHQSNLDSNLEPDLGRVESLFQAAADLSPDDREALLNRECGDDHLLRERITRLLERLDADASLTVPVMDIDVGTITEGPGAIIGRYKLLQEIGEGGFGVVYMAEQQKPVVRKVALKIIKLGMDTRQVIARFEAERQALALMDHPNIARVLDGGATESGRPYFVMELVRGLPLTEYCDKNDLTPRERMELFEHVCHAVHHAHQKGVIHRDLKPSNVLVTLHDGRPVPKVIDFGVAKAMHMRLTDKTLFTRYEQFIGTPTYMSPEQASLSALDVDTRTDIYSLGVLLYELLTGTTPFDTTTFSGGGLIEMQRVIREELPPRPSLRISTSGTADVARHRGSDVRGLSRVIRGDLDWIVMKALEKDRSRRYASASEFAEDIRRHLEHEPVIAGPPRTSYRVRKFLARNRAATATVVLVALALISGSITTWLQKVQADRHAVSATEQAEHAMVALDFVLSVLSLTNPAIALEPDISVRDLLAHAADEASEVFKDQPWAEVRVRSSIGQAYAALGQLDLAEPQLRRVVELVEQLESQGEGLGSSGYGDLDYYHVMWTLTNVAFHLERGDAFMLASAAHRICIRCVEREHPEVASALDEFTMAVTEGAWSHDESSMDGVMDAFNAVTRLCDRDIPNGDLLWPTIADRFLSAGYTVWYTVHEPLCEHFFGEALKIQQRELRPAHPHTARSVGLLVNILNKQDRAFEAEGLIRASLESLYEIHANTDLVVAITESTLGENLTFQRRFAEAEPLLLRAHDVILDHVQREDNFNVVESLFRIVIMYDLWDKPEKAASYRDILANSCAEGTACYGWHVTRRVLSPEHSDLVDTLTQLADLCGLAVSFSVQPGTYEADPEVINPLLHRLESQLASTLDPRAPVSVAIARVLLCWTNSLNPETNAEARRLLAVQARRIFEATESDTRAIDLAECYGLLAEAAALDNQPEIGRRLALDALRTFRDADRPSMWFSRTIEIRIGRSLHRLGYYSEAEPILVGGLDALKSQIGGGHQETLATRQILYELYMAWGRADQASEYAPTAPAPDVPTTNGR